MINYLTIAIKKEKIREVNKLYYNTKVNKNYLFLNNRGVVVVVCRVTDSSSLFCMCIEVLIVRNYS